MPSTKISTLTVLSDPAAGDLIPIVDISDTTMAASGTTKRVTQSVLLASAQPLDATLTALAGLTIAADSLTLGTGADAFTQTAFAPNTLPARASTGSLAAKPITDFGLSLIDDAASSNARTTLGLGTIATQAASSVAITGGIIDGTTVGATTPATGAFTSLSTTGITTVASGTALLPSIVSTTGTADTGLWFPAADTLAASTAGSERIRISSTGNVGIGTTAPDKVCEINLGPSSALRLTYNDANGSAATYMDTTVSSVGLTTFTAAGSAPSFTFANAVAMAASKALTVATGDNYGLKFSGGGTIEEYSNNMVLSAPYTGFIFYSPQTGTNVLTIDNTSATFLLDFTMGAAKGFSWAGTGCSMTGPSALNLVAYQNFDFTTSGGSGRKVFTIENTGVIRSYYAYTNASNYQRFSINQTANSFTLAAETAGTGAANIDVIIAPAGTGKVGIGITIPTSTLHVVGDSNLGGFTISSAGVVTAGTVPADRVTGLTNLEAIYNSMLN